MTRMNHLNNLKILKSKNYYCQNGNNELNCLKNKKQVEKSSVSFSNTISNPRTMMIISSDTMIALFTMFAS